MRKHLKWVEIDSEALRKNISSFRNLIGPDRLLYPVVKANAYGHDLLLVTSIIQDLVDGFAVNHLDEALAIRNSGIDKPILTLGYTLKARLNEAVVNDISLGVYDKDVINELGSINKPVKVHIKVETGTSRQGVLLSDLEDFILHIQQFPNVEIEGIYTHYANIEDTTDHSYAELQLDRFKKAVEITKKLGLNIPIKHTACTAATILFPETYFDMVRVGIGTYGYWSSNETLLSAKQSDRQDLDLVPALTWKTRVAQIKWIEEGTPIGYGLTHITTRRTKIAVLPVGYSDGYDRKLSNNSYVTIKGERAPVLGRIMMNTIVVDVTDIEDARPEDEVVLLGKGGMSAEEMASRAGTINYEIVTRINWDLKRVVV